MKLISLFILVCLLLFACYPEAFAEEVTFKNCTNYWYGYVKWDGPEHSRYDTFPEEDQIKAQGIFKRNLEQGLYGITKYDPFHDLVISYWEFVVYATPLTINLGCE